MGKVNQHKAPHLSLGITQPQTSHNIFLGGWVRAPFQDLSKMILHRSLAWAEQEY